MRFRIPGFRLRGRSAASATVLVAAIAFVSGCAPSPTYQAPTSVAADLSVLSPIEVRRLRAEETYALAWEVNPHPPREATDPRPRLDNVQLTYLAYGLGCISTVGENMPEKDKTNGDISMLLEIRGPGLKVHEVRYPYEYRFFDKFFLSRPGRIDIALTLRSDATKEVFDKREFAAVIDRALHAEVVSEDLADGAESVRVRTRIVVDPAHYVDKCRVEAILIELASPGDDSGRLLGHWKLKIDPQDDASFRYDLKRASSPRGPAGPKPYALRLRLVDGNKVVESEVLRFTVP